jgi:hypothetical protein
MNKRKRKLREVKEIAGSHTVGGRDSSRHQSQLWHQPALSCYRAVATFKGKGVQDD